MTYCRVWNIHIDRQTRRGCLRSVAKYCTGKDKENTRREYCFDLVYCLCGLGYHLPNQYGAELVSSPAMFCGNEQRRALGIPLVPPETVSPFSNANGSNCCRNSYLSQQVLFVELSFLNDSIVPRVQY